MRSVCLWLTLIAILLATACTTTQIPVLPTQSEQSTPSPAPTATPDPSSLFEQALDSARQDGYLPASYTDDPGGEPVLSAELDLAPFRERDLLPLSPDGLELGRINGDQLVLPHLEAIAYPNPATGELAIYSFSNSDGAWNTYTNHGGPALKVPASLPTDLADLVGVYHAPGKDPALVGAKLMPDGSIKIIPIVFTEDENVAFSAQSVIKDGQEVFYNQLTSAWEPLPPTPIPTETPTPEPSPTATTEAYLTEPIYNIRNVEEWSDFKFDTSDFEVHVDKKINHMFANISGRLLGYEIRDTAVYVYLQLTPSQVLKTQVHRINKDTDAAVAGKSLKFYGRKITQKEAQEARAILDGMLQSQQRPGIIFYAFATTEDCKNHSAIKDVCIMFIDGLYSPDNPAKLETAVKSFIAQIPKDKSWQALSQIPDPDQDGLLISITGR